MSVNVAIFASGSGSNAENIVLNFKNNPNLHVRLILSNKADAFVLERAKKLGVPSIVFSKKDFDETQHILSVLLEYQIDFIILAGFLLKVPSYLIKAFPDKIVNIHPALLPKYGGKGMYGDRVHQAVVDAKETESGITIHFVNEHYDEGNIIFQAKCEVLPTDTPDDVAQKVHELEYKYFPEVVADLVEK
jgi:phosphoribosylglycinamide formyltransferase-1